jgi:N-methylhydantoinase A/oxoprolinase/acetone carboxylase beta subunit
MLGRNAICYRKSQMIVARVGVDVGGTFTDVILHEADGRARVHKILSTPPNYDRAVVGRA